MKLITERPFYTLGRLPEWVIWLFFTAIMSAIVRQVLPNWGWFIVTYLPLLFFLGALSNSERATGFFAARRGTVALVCVVLAVATTLSLTKWYPVVAPSPQETFGTNPIWAYLMIGSVLGALLRNGISVLITLALLGKKRLAQSVVVTAVWSSAILLFPWEVHHEAAPWYTAGLGAGVIISRSFRLRVTRAAEAFWRIQEVSESFPKGASISEAEREALHLLARGRELPFLRYRELRRRLEEWRGSDQFSTRIALISASVFRLEGNHLAAVAEAGPVSRTPELLEEAHLILLGALSLFEIGKDEQAEVALKELLETEHGQRCPLAAATQALQLASAAAEGLSSVTPVQEPIEWLRTALDRRREVILQRFEPNVGGSDSEDDPQPIDPVDRFIAKFTEVGIPLSIPYYLDIHGFCLVLAGYPEEGRVFLDRCLELDRSFSQAYLHLGDYFLLRGDLSGFRRRKKHDLWHAKACYFAALLLESSPGSRVRRTAQRHLKAVDEMARANGI